MVISDDVLEEPPNVETFTRHVGCADVYFGAESPPSGPRTSERVRLGIVTGSMLRRPCDDTPWPQRIDAVYHATGGTATSTDGPEALRSAKRWGAAPSSSRASPSSLSAAPSSGSIGSSAGP